MKEKIIETAAPFVKELFVIFNSEFKKENISKMPALLKKIKENPEISLYEE